MPVVRVNLPVQRASPNFARLRFAILLARARPRERDFTAIALAIVSSEGGKKKTGKNPSLCFLCRKRDNKFCKFNDRNIRRDKRRKKNIHESLNIDSRATGTHARFGRRLLLFVRRAANFSILRLNNARHNALACSRWTSRIKHRVRSVVGGEIENSPLRQQSRRITR